MSNFLQDLRFGVRMLLQQPTMSAIAVIALGLGIGLTTTMYSIVHAAMADMPFEEAHELYHLEQVRSAAGNSEMALDDYDFLDWRSQQTSFEDLAAFTQGTINVAGTEQPVRYEGAFVMAEIFTLLGVEAHVGRVIAPSDTAPGAQPVLVLGYDVWRNYYDSDPNIVGTEVRINGQPGTIIGVMPDGFRFPMMEEAWAPLVIDTATTERGQQRRLDVLARLRDGVEPETALAELESISERLEAQYPVLNEGVRPDMDRFVREYLDPPAIMMLWTMQGAVFLVLLIACANVANLLLARALDRSREVAVRASLGASRARIVSQMLTEALVLAAFGGALGLMIARVGVLWFNDALVGVEVPFWIVVELDPQVLLFSGVVVGLAAVLAGVMPAWQITSTDLNDVLKDETRGSSSLRMGRIGRALVVAEVALSCGLLVGAGLMIKSVTQLASLDYGFRTDVYSARLGLFEGDYPDPGSRREFFDELQRRIAAEPGVVATTLADALPGTYRASMSRITIEGEAYATPQDHPAVNFATIGPGFFETFEARIESGRDFSDDDRFDGLPVAIVNASFAARFFPGTDPIGQRFHIGTSEIAEVRWLTVIGTVPDLYMEGIGDTGNRPAQGFYLPLAQSDRRFVSIVARANADHMQLSEPVRQAVSSLDANLPLYWVRPLQSEIDSNTWFYNVFGSLFMTFGAVALFLAAIGLYGVMSFAVGRRTQEVGIRKALGAQRGDVLRLVLRQGVLQIGLGLGLGVGLAMLTAGGLELVLFQVDPHDAVVYGTVLAVLAAAGLGACAVPALRAARIDPIEALRT
jgi:predicted permease